jgi:DNA-directed RNA polymerase sigma subunit (sigma70/sigma32)
MTKQDDIPKTDPSEIEALIQRLKQSSLEPRDAQLVERLLRLVLSMASLLRKLSASVILLANSV